MDLTNKTFMNYLCYENLLELSREDFDEKETLIKALVEKEGCEEGELPEFYKIGKIISLKDVLPNTAKDSDTINDHLDSINLIYLLFQKNTKMK